LAEQLRRFRGVRISVFEEGFVVTGVIEAIKDNQVLVLRDAQRYNR